MENDHVTETEIWAYISKSADKETRERVEFWKESDQFDPHLYGELTGIYRHTQEETLNDADIPKAKESFFETIPQSYPNKTTSFKVFAKYAAVAVMALIFAMAYFLSEQAGKTVISTAYGEQKEVTLPDGSAVWLNSSSHLSYDTSKPREMYLVGEAFFEVVKDEKAPFIVNMENQLKITVLGTSFNVKAYAQNGYMETVLLEGVVELSLANQADKVRMVPNDKVTFVKRDRKLIKSKIDFPADAISWREGLLRFDDKRFAEIAADLEIQHNVKIQFQNDKISNSKFTGSFERETTIEEILETLQLTKSFKFHQSSDGTWVVE